MKWIREYAHTVPRTSPLPQAGQAFRQRRGKPGTNLKRGALEGISFMVWILVHNNSYYLNRLEKTNKKSFTRLLFKFLSIFSERMYRKILFRHHYADWYTVWKQFFNIIMYKLLSSLTTVTLEQRPPPCGYILGRSRVFKDLCIYWFIHVNTTILVAWRTI